MASAVRVSTLPVISSALKWAQGVLAEAGVDSPRLDAELLLVHTLRLRRAQLYTHPERTLRAGDEARYERLIVRRARREPLAYLLGHREFYGLDFAVDRRVLIPRPETELLVEQAISRGGQLLTERDDLTIADIGTGSGAIAVALARMLPLAQVYAVDISQPALEVARQNSQRHGVGDRVHPLWGDLLAPLPRPVDMIVANLPYIAPVDVPALPAEVSSYEPRLAWDGGAEGLEVIARLLNQAPGRVADGGSILLEIGAMQGVVVRRMALQRFPAATVEVLQDGAGLDRVVAVEPASATGGAAQGRRDGG